MRSFLVLASLIASALAITVTFPRDNDVWGSQEYNRLSWTSVNTDPTHFRVVLITPDQKETELMAQVDTNLGSISIPPLSTGFPVGDKWKINLMSIPDTTTQQAGILAQSGSFKIVAGSASSTGTVTGTAPTTLSRVSTAVAATTTAGVVSSSVSEGTLNPTQSANGASGFAKASGALVGAAGILYALVL